MLLPVGTLINYLEQLAPRHRALEWDNVGLQLGSPRGTVEKILVTLDVDLQVLDEADASGADFIISHHPVIFRPLPALRTDLYPGMLLARALSSGIRIFAAHTNLDVAEGGVNDALAERLNILECQVLKTTSQDDLEKVVVFSPHGHEDNIRNAMAKEGAGWIGKYSHCSFQSSGTGTFMPLDGTNPFIGRQGELERVEEIMIETIVPSSLRNRVIKSLLKAHPYEEVAFDIYPLQNEGTKFGLGRIGRLADPCTLAEFCSQVKERLAAQQLRVTGDPDSIIKKAAVSAGAGADLIHAAAFAGADVLVTGDLKYHEARDAAALGLAVIDAGHDVTEKVIVPSLCSYLQEKINRDGFNTPVLSSQVKTAPWWFYQG